MQDKDNLTKVDYSNHGERIDLTGRDLMSVFGRSKAELAASLGLEFGEEPVATILVPAARVTSMAGEVADEVHDWPNASQGSSFRSLCLQFRNGSVIALEWNFSLEEFLPKKKAWYRRIFRAN